MSALPEQYRPAVLELVSRLGHAATQETVRVVANQYHLRPLALVSKFTEVAGVPPDQFRQTYPKGGEMWFLFPLSLRALYAGQGTRSTEPEPQQPTEDAAEAPPGEEIETMDTNAEGLTQTTLDQEAKYAYLSPVFLRGGTAGQIRSVYKDKDEKPKKVEEYKQAVADGDCKIDQAELTDDLVRKLYEMGFDEATIGKPMPAAKEQPKYPALSASFMRGSLAGQIDSAYKDKDNADKVNDFKAAIAAGDIPLKADGLKASHVRKLVELGVDVPAEIAEAVKGAGTK